MINMQALTWLMDEAPCDAGDWIQFANNGDLSIQAILEQTEHMRPEEE